MLGDNTYIKTIWKKKTLLVPLGIFSSFSFLFDCVKSLTCGINLIRWG